jgi:hypothetical protein
MNNICEKCGKTFKSLQKLNNHVNKIICVHQCNICLKTFTRKETLINHTKKVKCNKTIIKSDNLPIKNINIPDINFNIPDIKNLPNDRNIIINNNNNYYINNDNKVTNVENKVIDNKVTNVDNKIIDNKVTNNIDNKVTNIDNKVTNNIDNKVTNNNVKITNFFQTNPKRHFNYPYEESIELINELLKLDDAYDEMLIDMFNHEDDFQDKYPELHKKYNDSLQVNGLKKLFTLIQQDPENRNIMIKKIKSGKCFVYESKWIERELQASITTLCKKLCNCLYNRITSPNTNEHVNTIIHAPKDKGKYIELRKHIENEIIQANPKNSNLTAKLD